MGLEQLPDEVAFDTRMYWHRVEHVELTVQRDTDGDELELGGEYWQVDDQFVKRSDDDSDDDCIIDYIEADAVGLDIPDNHKDLVKMFQEECGAVPYVHGRN